MPMRYWVLLLLLPALALAQTPLPELKLIAEYPVQDMHGGNLSGLAVCQGTLQAVSDRDDQQLYHLHLQDGVFQAQAEEFIPPPAAHALLPWGLRVRNQVVSWVRGGFYDFEGLSCDAQGNRYLVSETLAAVLMLPPNGPAQWLNLPSSLLRQARASGMLLNVNQGFEGIAVNPSASQLWLAAEQRRRGLLTVHKRGNNWNCAGGCVLLSEPEQAVAPAGHAHRSGPEDFSGLAFFAEKLFTLERQSHRICRRNLERGETERCWSFAQLALEQRPAYSAPYGLSEALWIDTEGAWVGLDNGALRRADGEQRPIVWRLAAPAGGWSAKP